MQNRKSGKKNIVSRIPGVEPGADEAFHSLEVRVIDVTATPYPINRYGFRFVGSPCSLHPIKCSTSRPVLRPGFEQKMEVLLAPFIPKTRKLSGNFGLQLGSKTEVPEERAECGCRWVLNVYPGVLQGNSAAVTRPFARPNRLFPRHSFSSVWAGLLPPTIFFNKKTRSIASSYSVSLRALLEDVMPAVLLTNPMFIVPLRKSSKGIVPLLSTRFRCLCSRSAPSSRHCWFRETT